MLQLDDVQLYDLSEAGPLLYRDPARLERMARIRAIPATRVGAILGLPAPWVDAASGRSAADPASLAMYWLGRLAPASADARRPRRERARLPAEELLTAAEAARRLFATFSALERIEREGRMPALRVDGEVCYDATLVDLMAAEADDPAAASARRAEVSAWARFEYTTTPAPVEPRSIPLAATPLGSVPKTAEAPTADEAPEPAAPAPGAYEIPTDLGFDAQSPDGGTAFTSDLLEIEGFDTIDED